MPTPAFSTNIYLRRRLTDLPPVDMTRIKDVVFWRFAILSTAFCACSLLPLLLRP